MKDVILAVHGGAGKLIPADLIPEFRAGMESALRAGRDARGTSVDAVEAAVLVLEDNELFNAGKGSVFTEDSGHELDASIMRGWTRPPARSPRSAASATPLPRPVW